MCLISFCYANTPITNQREAGITHIVPNIYTRSRSSSSPGEAKHYISTMKPHYHIYFGGLSHKKSSKFKTYCFFYLSIETRRFLLLYIENAYSALSSVSSFAGASSTTGVSSTRASSTTGASLAAFSAAFAAFAASSSAKTSAFF